MFTASVQQPQAAICRESGGPLSQVPGSRYLQLGTHGTRMHLSLHPLTEDPSQVNSFLSWPPLAILTQPSCPYQVLTWPKEVRLTSQSGLYLLEILCYTVLNSAVEQLWQPQLSTLHPSPVPLRCCASSRHCLVLCTELCSPKSICWHPNFPCDYIWRQCLQRMWT
jgi:hypothetical protein